ncbi:MULTISPECIES: hypothetical protein [Phenylobacterium]|uniref:RES domain-containing protein n=1 Tax=Phenylobacterium koreense TaxID=266125 RepID=A0ABV2EEJ8_9CAUL
MLFLLNDVVFNLEGLKPWPKISQRAFQALPFNVISRLGQELYSEEPLLHFDRPERGRRLATLILAKAPSINAALFVAPRYGCAPEEVSIRYANLDFTVMARLSSRQAAGEMDTLATDREVWRRLAA